MDESFKHLTENRFLILVTACGRPDLLQATINSLLPLDNPRSMFFVHEDSNPSIPVDIKKLFPPRVDGPLALLRKTEGCGQHDSIEKFLNNFTHSEAAVKKYYLHLEEDWEFSKPYDWIKASIDIMEKDPSIIKVLAREDSPHANKTFFGKVACNTQDVDIYKLNNWENNDITWQGFSWNPGVTRLDLLKKFVPFPKWEQDLAEKIYKAGYKVVELATPVYKHIGVGRSTHE